MAQPGITVAHPPMKTLVMKSGSMVTLRRKGSSRSTFRRAPS